MCDNDVKEKDQGNDGKYKTVLELHEGKKVLEQRINQLVSEFVEKLPSMVKLEEVRIETIQTSYIGGTTKSTPYISIKLDVEA